jgi:hypothetical protein
MKILFLAVTILLAAVGSSGRAAEQPARFLFAYGGISASALPLWIG